MGCGASAEGTWAHDADLVRESWAAFTALHTAGLAPAGAALLQAIVAMDPTLEAGPLRCADAAALPTALMDAAAEAVRRAEDAEALDEHFERLGVALAAAGVVEGQLALGGEALVQVMSGALGKRWREAYARAWSNLSSKVEAAARRGMTSPAGAAGLDSHRRRERARHFGVVSESWAAAKAAGEGMVELRDVFERAFAAQHPGRLRVLLRKAERAGRPVDFVKMIDELVALLPAPEQQLAAALEAAGLRNTGAGLEAGHFPVVGVALVHSLASQLGDRFTAELRVSWAYVYDLIERQLQAAAASPAGVEARLAFEQRLAAEEREHIVAVTDSWLGTLEKFDLQVIGDSFYHHLFANEPSMRRTMFRNVDSKTQARKLMEMFDAAVGLLMTNQSQLDAVLADLGTRHCSYGVFALSHYTAVGKAIVATLRDLMGDGFTAEHDEAWEDVYEAHIALNMMEGALSDRGQTLLRQYTDKQRARFSEHCQLAAEAWGKIRAAGGLAALGKRFYARLIDGDSTMETTVFRGVDRDLLSKKLVDMFDSAIVLVAEQGGARDDLVARLRVLGARHGGFGIEVRHYTIFGEALIAEVGVTLGEAFTPEAGEAVMTVYYFMEEHMQDGIASADGAAAARARARRDAVEKESHAGAAASGEA